LIDTVRSNPIIPPVISLYKHLGLRVPIVATGPPDDIVMRTMDRLAQVDKLANAG
jgi:hypothetical protein